MGLNGQKINTAPYFSVVIPTYQRREVVVTSVQALANQEYDRGFEVIVVVDGSTDGTAEALRALKMPFPLTIIEQPNQGASVARNKGAEMAKGAVLLFLDDDMVAHPCLLAEHDRSHREGAEVVVGDIPLHPESPVNFLSLGVKKWAEDRSARLSASNGRLALHDLLTGQLSVRRAIFSHIAGFDTQFTFGGSFGNEDIDFGYRILQEKYKIVFNPRAVSRQKYVVSPRQYLRQWRQAGRADVALVRKYPELIKDVFFPRRIEPLKARLIWRWFRWFFRWVVLSLVDLGVAGERITRPFFWVRNLEYWQGVREAGGIPKPRPLRILCYHSISDLKSYPLMKNYGIPPEEFRRQIETLLKHRFHFIDANEFLRFLRGQAGLPRRPVLLTFDDCYQDNLDVALPILREKRIPAVAFAVSNQTGSTNEWDVGIGAPRMQLLDADGLKQLAQSGIVIGAHSRTHPMLNRISTRRAWQEVAGSVNELEAIGLPRPFLFAYPYGEYNDVTRQCVKKAGLAAGFTVNPGFALPGQDPYALPRIEVLREDSGWKFLWKVLWGGRKLSLYRHSKMKSLN